MSENVIPQPVAKPFKVARSARLLTIGVLLLIVGQFVAASGQRQALEAALDPSPFASGGGGALAVGGVILLAGLILTLLGISRLADNIDRIAERVLQ